MFSRDEKLDQLRLIASRDGRDGSVTVHQHVDLYASVLQAGNEVTHPIADSKKVFVQVVSGSIAVNDEVMSAGDGMKIKGEEQLSIVGQTEAEFLLFDMG